MLTLGRKDHRPAESLQRITVLLAKDASNEHTYTTHREFAALRPSQAGEAKKFMRGEIKDEIFTTTGVY